MKLILAIALCSLCSIAFGAGTINLPSGPYCATQIVGGAYNGVTAGACAVVIPPTNPGAGCPAVAHTPWGDRTLVTRAAVCYGATCAGSRYSVDVTKWEGLIGLGSNGATTPAAWPGIGGNTPTITAFPAKGYICAEFTVTGSHTGQFSARTDLRLPSPSTTMAISRTGGDFSADLPTPGCVVRNVPNTDGNLVLWKTTTNAPNSWCNLTPGRYYLNLMLGDVPGCSKATCALGITSYAQ